MLPPVTKTEAPVHVASAGPAPATEPALPFEYIIIYSGSSCCASEQKAVDIWKDDYYFDGDDNADEYSAVIDDIDHVVRDFKALSTRTEETQTSTATLTVDESASVVSSLDGFASVKSMAKRNNPDAATADDDDTKMTMMEAAAVAAENDKMYMDNAKKLKKKRKWKARVSSLLKWKKKKHEWPVIAVEPAVHTKAC